MATPTKKYTRKLSVTGPGRSYYLILPREVVKSLKWKKGEKKSITQKGKTLLIKDWKRKR